jgi:hypothetical protein
MLNVKHRGSPEMKQYREAPRRNCPRCGNVIMAAATKCGFCWAKLASLVA